MRIQEAEHSGVARDNAIKKFCKSGQKTYEVDIKMPPTLYTCPLSEGWLKLGACQLNVGP